jgi:hypothetical protein
MAVERVVQKSSPDFLRPTMRLQRKWSFGHPKNGSAVRSEAPVTITIESCGQVGSFSGSTLLSSLLTGTNPVPLF